MAVKINREAVVETIRSLISELHIDQEELFGSNDSSEEEDAVEAAPVKASVQEKTTASKYSAKEIAAIEAAYLGNHIKMADGTLGTLKTFYPDRGVVSVVTGPHRPKLIPIDSIVKKEGEDVPRTFKKGEDRYFKVA